MSDPDDGAADLRERTRQQLLASFGGVSGTIVAGLPPLVFVIVNAISGLHPAIIAAIASGVAAAGYRLARRQPLQQAITGLLSVVVAAAIAARGGQARDYFALGIITAFVYGGVLAASLVVRRPLVGLAWEFLDPSVLTDGARWFQVRRLLHTYDVITAAAATVFLARGIVQLSLFHRNRTGWLAIARLAMGYPLYVAVIGLAFVLVRRTRRRLAAEAADSA